MSKLLMNACFFFSRKLGLLLGWVVFALVAYKTSQVELDFSEFDPFGELGIDRVSLYESI